MSDVTWGPASPETIESIVVGGQVFVRPDWDAYKMGQLDGIDKARAVIVEAKLWMEDPYADKDLLAAIDVLRSEI